MKDTIYKDFCYGCSACAMICPTGSISMIENEKGFLVPEIDETKCIQCEKCVSVCRQKPNYNEDNKAYIVKLKDEASLIKSQSGGAFAAISDIILKQGGSIYGAVLNEKFEAEHMRASNVEERDRMRGSKYVQSNMKNMYKCVERDIEERPVLFSGTPCQVNGLNKYLREKNKLTDNLITVDLICHGVPSVLIWRDLIKYYEKQVNDKVIDVIFRNYLEWGEHFTTLNFKNKDIEDIFHRNLFYTNLALRDSCYGCEFARMERVSDFTIGDAWGVKEHNSEFYDAKGVSLILLHTQKAQKIFETARKDMFVQQVSVEDYKQGNMEHPSVPNRSIEDFWKDYREKDFDYIIRKYAKNDIYLNRKYILNKILKKLKLKNDVLQALNTWLF